MQTNYFLPLIAAFSLASAHRYEVDTSIGKVDGYIDPAIPGVKQWLGIPFAELPIGPLRFLAPVTKAKGQKIDACNQPASCQQYQSALSSIFNNATPQFFAPPPYKEDCLYLNIITPTKSNENDLPVLVWFHGGMMMNGGINTPYEQPHKWVQ